MVHSVLETTSNMPVKGSKVLVGRVRLARVLVAGVRAVGCNVNDGFGLVLVDGHRKVCVDKDRGFCRVWGVAA